MIRFSSALLIIGLAAGLPIGEADAYTITIEGAPGSSVRSVARGPDGTSFDSETVVALPVSHSLTAADGGASSTSTFSLRNDGFDITMDDHTLDSGLANAYTNANIYFSVDQAVNYSATGSYSSANLEDGFMEWWVTLGGETVFEPRLFFNDQNSNLPNDDFTLGGPALFGIDFQGSLTGTLVPGSVYNLFHRATIGGRDNPSASASGNFSLTFSAVPEPNTAMLAIMGFLALAATRRRFGTGILNRLDA